MLRQKAFVYKRFFKSLEKHERVGYYKVRAGMQIKKVREDVAKTSAPAFSLLGGRKSERESESYRFHVQQHLHSLPRYSHVRILAVPRICTSLQTRLLIFQVE